MSDVIFNINWNDSFLPICFTIALISALVIFIIRLRLSTIYLQTKLSQYTDVVPWLIYVVDLIFPVHPLWRHLHVWRWHVTWYINAVFWRYVDSCSPPFPGLLMNFYLQASSAYWRGNKDRESLQRVYGISYPDQKRLKVKWFFLLCFDSCC